MDLLSSFFQRFRPGSNSFHPFSGVEQERRLVHGWRTNTSLTMHSEAVLERRISRYVRAEKLLRCSCAIGGTYVSLPNFAGRTNTHIMRARMTCDRTSSSSCLQQAVRATRLPAQGVLQSRYSSSSANRPICKTERRRSVNCKLQTAPITDM